MPMLKKEGKLMGSGKRKRDEIKSASHVPVTCTLFVFANLSLLSGIKSRREQTFASADRMLFRNCKYFFNME